MSIPRWYLIQSKAHQENAAELNLRRWGVETFCPRLEDSKFTVSKSHRKGEVLFPGYLFIKTDMTRDFRKLTYTHGVLRVVKFGVTPAIVDEDMINSIRDRTRRGRVVLSIDPFLESGQIVRINQGFFHGFEAIFKQKLNGAQRVSLLLKTVAFQGRMVIDRSCVGLP